MEAKFLDSNPGFSTRNKKEPLLLLFLAYLFTFLGALLQPLWLLVPIKVLAALGGVWCPKKHIVSAVKNAMAPFSSRAWDSASGGCAAKAGSDNPTTTTGGSPSSSSMLVRPNNDIFGCPAIMDSGLLMVANRPPDGSGFEPFAWTPPNGEAIANKGMLWARFNSVVVVTTHMTAEVNEEEKLRQVRSNKHRYR